MLKGVLARKNEFFLNFQPYLASPEGPSNNILSSRMWNFPARFCKQTETSFFLWPFVRLWECSVFALLKNFHTSYASCQRWLSWHWAISVKWTFSDIFATRTIQGCPFLFLNSYSICIMFLTDVVYDDYRLSLLGSSTHFCIWSL